MDKLRALTADELDALRSWAKQHGRYWKVPLRDLWNRAVVALGMPNSDRNTTVYCLRNSHGPSWLRDFRLRATPSTLPAPEEVDCPECKHELATGEAVPDGVTHSCDRAADFDNGGAT